MTSPQFPKSDQFDAQTTLLGVAEAIDDAADGRVLVFGSPPQDARDLDLLAREPEHDAIASRLAGEGFIRKGVEWVAFRDCAAVGVDLVPAAAWELPPGELAALFEQADVMPGFRHLAVPAPDHALLIAARRVARGGRYEDRLRERIAALVDGVQSAWQDAARRAPAWDAVDALAALRALHAGGAAPGRTARARALGARLRSARAPYRRRAAARAVRRAAGRPAIVAFSGLDGAGKSFQAMRLQEALERLGRTAVVVWPPASNVIFQANPALKRRLLAVLDALGRRSEAGDESVPAPAGEPSFEPLPRQSAPVAHGLAFVVAFAQAWAFRRGAAREARRVDVVIYDRYALDSIVYLRHRWGHGRAFRLESALIRRLARRPDCAFFLDLPPEVAYARKQDFPIDNLRERAALYHELHQRLGVERLDGERPREELCADIARTVWERLG